MRKVDLRFFFISEKNIMQINFSSQNSEEFTYTNFFYTNERENKRFSSSFFLHNVEKLIRLFPFWRNFFELEKLLVC